MESYRHKFTINFLPNSQGMLNKKYRYLVVRLFSNPWLTISICNYLRLKVVVECEKMNIGVVGGGSLGLLISSYLAEHHKVTLYVRRMEQKAAIEKNHIQLWKQSTLVKQTTIEIKEMRELEEEDCLFICVKQPQIKQVVTYLHHLKGKSKIVFLQNGMGHVAEFKTLQHPVFVGVVEHGAHRMSDYQVNHLGEGIIKLASFTNEKNLLLSLLKQIHTEEFPFDMHHDWQLLLQEKLMINAVINPLTALFDVPNGRVVSNSDILFLAKQLSQETAEILGFDPNFVWENVKRVAENTEHNTSSMRADLQANRETEIEAISGYLIKRAAEHLIPYTTFVYKAILGLHQERIQQ